MRWTWCVVLAGMCLYRGGPATGAPGDGVARLDRKLTAGGQKQADEARKRQDQTTGRLTKEEWAQRVGSKDDPMYKGAATHMPAGVGLGVRIADKAAVARADKEARQYALAQAKRLLARDGKPVTDAVAIGFLAGQDAQIRQLNRRLAEHQAAFAEQARKNQPAEMARARRALMRELRGGTREPGPPEGATQAERDIMQREVMTWHNRAAARGAR
jgi:hypothetical protein